MLKVLTAGSEVLRVKTEARSLDEIQEDIGPEWGELSALLNEMNVTMLAENGMGLAANQVGYSLRLFILKDTSGQGFSEYINPEVLSMDELVSFEEEGCLSIPGVTATTKRFNKLKLRWMDRQGKTQEGSFEGIGAFAVQHEMDHLNGKLYVDQLGPTERRLLMKKHEKFMRTLRRR